MKEQMWNDAVCDEQVPLEEIRWKMPLDVEMQEHDFFKVFGELSRIKILLILLLQGTVRL